GDSVEDNEATAVEWVARHERLGQIIKAGAVDDHAGLSDGVDERTPGGVAQHECVPTFAGIEERLADTAIYDERPVFHDLGQLILSVAMHDHLRSVDAGGQIVS